MTIEERLTKLERTNRKLKGGLVVLALGLISLVTMAAAPRDGNFRKITAEIIEARVIDAVDEKGKAWVEMVGTSKGGALQIKGKNGKAIVQIGPGRDGGGQIFLNSSQGKPIIAIGPNKDGGGLIIVYDPQDRANIKLNATDKGGAISVRNQMGKIAAALAGIKSGALSIHDNNGKKLTVIVRFMIHLRTRKKRTPG